MAQSWYFIDLGKLSSKRLCSISRHHLPRHSGTTGSRDCANSSKLCGCYEAGQQDERKAAISVPSVRLQGSLQTDCRSQCSFLLNLHGCLCSNRLWSSGTTQRNFLLSAALGTNFIFGSKGFLWKKKPHQQHVNKEMMGQDIPLTVIQHILLLGKIVPK